MIKRAIILVCMSVMPCAPSTAETLDAQARYYHHRHHPTRTRHHVERYLNSRVPVVSMGETNARPTPLDKPVKPIAFAFVTGTSVHDNFSGREPVIGPNECVNPMVDWYRIRPVRTWQAWTEAK